ncbi:hypothetical protein HC928_08500 [bacterium]|nr:hypothetical protein [bacterium]
MAEEHVVIPKDRYQRMLDQLAEKKQHDTAEPMEKTQNEDPITEKNNTDDSDVQDARDRDDILDEFQKKEEKEENMTEVGHVPPGITREELKTLIRATKTSRKKIKKTTPQRKEKKSKIKARVIVQKHSYIPQRSRNSKKTIALIKKNWQSMK